MRTFTPEGGGDAPGWPMSGIRPRFLGCLGARWPPMRGAVADCASVQVPALCERAEPIIIPIIAGYVAGASGGGVGCLGWLLGARHRVWSWLSSSLQ